MSGTLNAGNLEGQRPGNKPAQGNALGKPHFADKALKGRDNVRRPLIRFAHPFGAACGCLSRFARLRALSFFERNTQGVALGWLVCAPYVLHCTACLQVPCGLWGDGEIHALKSLIPSITLPCCSAVMLL